MTMTDSNVIQGAYDGQRTVAGVPVNGTSEVQTLTIGGTPTAGAPSNIKFRGADNSLSPAALWSATNATLLTNIQTALDSLFGTSQVVAALGTITLGVGTIILTYSGNLANLDVPLLVAVNNLTGTSPTAAITLTTAGVTATHRGAPIGVEIMDTTNGNRYVNQGTAVAPEWNSVTTS